MKNKTILLFMLLTTMVSFANPSEDCGRTTARVLYYNDKLSIFTRDHPDSPNRMAQLERCGDFLSNNATLYCNSVLRGVMDNDDRSFIEGILIGIPESECENALHLLSASYYGDVVRSMFAHATGSWKGENITKLPITATQARRMKIKMQSQLGRVPQPPEKINNYIQTAIKSADVVARHCDK